MRVALDARWMQHVPLNGVGRITAETIPHLRDRVDLTLLTTSNWPDLPEDLDLPVQSLTPPWPHVATAWLQWSAPRWLRHFDGVFHCPWYSLPLRQSVPMVTTIHDLTFEHHPEWFGRAIRMSYVTQARWAARTARCVIAPSQFVADDLMRTYRIPSSRMYVALPSVDAAFAPDLDTSGALAGLGVERPYVVALGGAARRNLDIAVAAWQATREETGLDLVVVGTPDHPTGPGIHGGFLPDGDWAAVLSGAVALLYPTGYEGFGIPALEAAASGTPVIAAKVGALPEVLGDAAVWCDATTVSAMTDGLRRLTRSAAFATEVRDAGLRRAAAHPTWAAGAEVHLAAYEAAAS